MINYVIGFGVAALVIFLVVRGIKRRKSGQVGGCGCSSCSSFSSCSSCSSATAQTCHLEKKDF